MRKVKVDRQSHPATFRSCKNLGQLIVSIEREGEAQNLFVIQVGLNGRTMDEDEEKLLESLALSEVEQLDITYASIDEMIGQSIRDMITAIQDIQLRAIDFCKEFRRQDQVDDEKVKFILIQCRSIIDSLEQVFAAHISQKFHIRHHSLWHEAEKELTNILQCILQGRRVSDAQFMSDLIEYDLVQALDQWEEALEKELIDNPSMTGIFSLKKDSHKPDNGVDA